MSDSTTNRPLIVEAGGIDHVGPTQRHGRPRNQFSVRFSPVIYLAPIFLGGAAIPLGLGLAGSITAIVVGNLLGSLAAGVCAAMGPRSGMPQMTMSRSSFGYRGNFIPAALSSILFIGYFAVGTVVGAKSLATLTGLPYTPIAAVVGVMGIGLALYGYQLLHITGRWVTAAGIILLLVVTVAALVHGTGSAASASLTGAEYARVWLLEFTVIFSFTVSWMLYASDYSRYLPSDSKFSAVFGFASSGLFLASTWTMTLGAVLVSISPAGGALDGMDRVLPGVVFMAVLISLTITSVTHNAVQLYSCAMSSLTWDLPMRRSHAVVASGLIGTALSIVLGGSDFQNNFNAFLILMSYFMLPWLAIRLIDFFWKNPDTRVPVSAFYQVNGPFGRVRWPGIIAFLVGIAVSTPFMSSDIFVGPVAQSLGGADISYFVSFAVAGLIYATTARPVIPTTVTPAEASPHRRVTGQPEGG